MKSTSTIKTVFLFVCSVIFLSTCKQKNESELFEGYGDVGNPNLTGSYVYDAATKTYTLTGGGVNIWNETDEFFYVWKKVKGDFSMTTKLAFEGVGVEPHRKTGIMIRESLTGDSRFAAIAIHGDGLTSLQYRSATGGITREVVGPAGGNYIRLEKVGQRIRMRTATDVEPNDVTAEIEMDFPGDFYIGFFICSHNADVLETVHFTEVKTSKEILPVPALFTSASNIGVEDLHKGGMVYDPVTGDYTLISGGENVWYNSDEFYYVWRKEKTDFTLSATLTFEDKEGNPLKKMGLMIRESLDADAKNVDIAVHGNGLTSLQYRAETGGITEEIQTSVIDPDRAVLIRNGKKIIIQAASGAVPDRDLAEYEMDFSGEFYVGMFVSTHDAERFETATFSNVRLERK
jgi:hypothetical protein